MWACFPHRGNTPYTSTFLHMCIARAVAAVREDTSSTLNGYRTFSSRSICALRTASWFCRLTMRSGERKWTAASGYRFRRME